MEIRDKMMLHKQLAGQFLRVMAYGSNGLLNDGRHLTERVAEPKKTSPSYADFARTTRSTSHSRS
jgi:hypothetical protein